MEDDVSVATRAELEEAYQIATKFIGREWIEEQVNEEFDNDPDEVDLRTEDTSDLLQQYYIASIFLGKRDDPFPEFVPEGKPSEPALHFTNLGRYLSDLDDAGVVTAEGDWLDTSLSDFFSHRLRNPDEYKQTVNEIQVGSIYSQMGYDVYFIDEGHQKAPDIWIPFEGVDIQIECKRCGTPGAHRDRAGIYESLLNRLTSAAHTPSVVLVELYRVPRPEEAQNIDIYLPNELSRSTKADIDAPFGRIKIIPYMEFTRTKTIPNAGFDATERLEFFYDYYILPVIYSTTGRKPNLYDDFERATIVTDENKVAISRREMDWFDPMFVGIQYDGQDDLITPILSQFDSARGKFEKDQPNILHVDVPYLEKIEQSDFTKLHQRLRGKLNVNSRVTAIALTTEITEWDTDGKLNSAVVCGAEANLDPYVELPDGFEMPGYSLSEMEGHPLLG